MMNSKELKVGDWIKHPKRGIGVISRENHDEKTVNFLKGFLGEVLNITTYFPNETCCELTKLKPKFDNFEELFEEEEPVETKFKVGDKVRMIKEFVGSEVIINKGFILSVVGYRYDDKTKLIINYITTEIEIHTAIPVDLVELVAD